MSLKPRQEGIMNGFCSLATTGLKGQVVKFSSSDNVIAIAGSGAGDGILAQDVVDFDGQLNSGYRDLAATTANVDDVVTMYQNGGLYESNVFVGTVSAGDELYSNASGYLEVFSSPAAGDEPIAKAFVGGTADAAGDDNSVFIQFKLLV